MKTTPNGNRYWLKEHQITAFWHGFGISNGLNVPIEYVCTQTYNKGTPEEVYVIRPEFMRKQLHDYVEWLKAYKKDWDTDAEHPHDADTREKFLEREQRHFESRNPILEMIELLQECRIDDK